MGKVTVIASFVVCIVFNIFLNSFDVYSDTALAVSALTFNLGDSILLSGCKVCHWKKDKDIYSVKKSKCQQCVTKNRVLHCGLSFEVLNKIDGLQQSNNCYNETFGVNWNKKEKSFDVINNSCDSLANVCCVKNTKEKIITSSLDHIDKRIFVSQPLGLKHVRNELDYEVYIMSGRLSYYYREGVNFDYVNRSWINIKPFLKNITLLKKPNETEWLFTSKRTISGRINISNNFTSTDGCGILVKTKEKNYAKDNAVGCGHDSCLVHLQRLKRYSNISNLDDWKKQTFYARGVKLGGKTCHLLWQYGLASLVPIFLKNKYIRI